MSPSSLRERPGTEEILLALALFGLVLAVFIPATSYGFIELDDPDYVAANPRVQQGLTPGNIGWAFTTFHAGNWHPLTWISHMVDCQLFGLDPSGHHLVSVVLHGLATVIFFLAFRKITGATISSWFAALLFGVHPLRVESVAWVAERKDVLSVLFWMLTIYAYAFFAAENSLGGWRGRIFYGLTIFCFCLGLMAKPMVVTLPFVLLLLDFWPLARYRTRSWRTLALEKAPLLILAAAVCALTLLAQGRAGAITESGTIGGRAANALASYGRYLLKFIWPSRLSPFYPPVSYSGSIVMLSVGVLAGVSVLAVRRRKSAPQLLTGWVWFLVTLVPVIGLVKAGDQSIADRYMYLPGVGLLLMVVWSLPLEAAWRPRVALMGALVVAAVCWAIATRGYLAYWRDTESLFTYALEIAPNNYRAQTGIGAALEKKGEWPGAARHYKAAVRINPGYAEGYNNLGVVCSREGRMEEAIGWYRKALVCKPRYPQAHNNLGSALGRTGKLEEAIAEHRKAIELEPGLADPHYDLGVALLSRGDVEEASGEFRAVLKIQPSSADAHNNLGFALDRRGDPAGAVAEYRAALALQPNYPRAHFNLGVALVKLGRLDEAIAQFEEAVREKPDYAEAKRNLESVREAKKGG